MVAIALAAIVFGGVKVIGRAAEIVVPIMSGIYILVALIILVVNYQAIPAAFSLIFKSAFDPDQFKGVKGFEHVDMSLWREIRDKFKSGQLKN